MLNGKSLYVPYDEADFILNSELANLSLSLPWLNVSIDVDSNQLSDVTETVESRLSDSEFVYSDKVQKFLKFFSDLPVLHSVPRTLNNDVESIDVYDSTASLIIDSEGPRQFIKAICGSENIDFDDAFSYFPDKWEWNAEEITSVANIQGTDLYDPASVYSALRRKRLLFQIAKADDAHKLISYVNTLKAKDEEAFFSAMADILSQQYYVTGQCERCLSAAIEGLPLISEQVKKYAQEEISHDKLILRSINKISKKSPDNFVFMPEVKAEIEVIRYAAENCAMGFSTLVSIMEGTVYPETDPVGDILKDSSIPEAQKGVEAHFQINKTGNHTAIPETFVECLPSVTYKTVEAATRLTEVTIRLDAGLAASMHRHITSEDFAGRIER